MSGAASFAGAIVKVTSRCNLNCSYCYMYNLGDSTWMDQPGVMQRPTIDALVARVAEHCEQHELKTFAFGFHGGEPLLMRREQLRYFVDKAREGIGPSTAVTFHMQTNGTLLSLEWCEALVDMQVQVGISLDGTEEVNDRFRLDHQGRGSYRAVMTGFENAARAGLDVGILTVIDPAADPEEVYEHLVSLGPRSVDLLLPEATHDKPPAHLAPRHDGDTMFGEWLLRFFARWSSASDTPFRVRRFDQIIGTVLGQIPPRDKPAAHHNRVVVIETDGGIEPVDVLKVCESGMTRTNMNVATHPLDAAFANPLVRQYYASYEELSDTCVQCSLRPICGGGYLPHRYRKSNGFDNPSVYCEDLTILIRGVQSWTLDQLPADLLQEAGVSR